MAASSITTLFFDLGGVLLTNAWDHVEREQALQHFQLDAAAFNPRHEAVVAAFERGEISQDEYLERTVFYSPRTFTREGFKQFMYSLSRPHEDALRVASSLAASGQYFMATLNNESTELNRYRIQTFRLREIFQCFVSSCYVRLRKPDPALYQLALDLTQKSPEECCFIDDRAENLEPAARVGMKTIRMQGAKQLRKELQQLGVEIPGEI
jgi:putative hydrolase of the HAD superfamily